MHRAASAFPRSRALASLVGRLLELGEIDEAIASLSAAKFCARYETPQFPYLNTARLLIRRGQLGAAAIELQAARLLAPADPRIGGLFEYVSVLVLARAA